VAAALLNIAAPMGVGDKNGTTRSAEANQRQANWKDKVWTALFFLASSLSLE